MTRPVPKLTRATALAAATAAAALALPAGANAALPASITGTSVTFRGDEAPDVLIIGDDGTHLTHNRDGLDQFASPTDFDSGTPGVQALPADGTISLTVNAGDGNDQVTIATNLLASVTVDGQGGNDVITGAANDDDLRGGDGNDQLRGGAGNDQLTGGPGTDDVEGGAGNDVATWNNRDGNDVVDGDAGADETVVNGASTAGDVFTIKPDPAVAGRVRFDRTNLVPFFIDLTSEKLTVNGLSGDDVVTSQNGLAPLTTLALSGDQGNDELSGADGPDVIRGGDGSDVLTGAGGDDSLTGDRGGDVAIGGSGDDVMVWNNGDGTDVNEGDDGFDTVEVNGAPTAGDGFGVAPDFTHAQQVRFTRGNLVPFSIGISTSEVLAVNGLGGDDTFAAADGTGLDMVVAGGSGNDTLRGSERGDTLAGGSGNDTLVGNAGADALDGQDGDDMLLARDGESDLVRGGAGTDAAETDQPRVDVLDGVEQVSALPVQSNRPPDAGPPAPPAAPPVSPAPQGSKTATGVATLVSKRVVFKRARHGFVATVRVRAPRGTRVRGDVELLTARRVRLAGIAAQLALGIGRFDLPAGTTASVRVRVSAIPRRVLRHGVIAARVRTASTDAGTAVPRLARLTVVRR